MPEEALRTILGVLLSMDNVYFLVTGLAVVGTAFIVDNPLRRKGAGAGGGLPAIALRSPRLRATMPAIFVLLAVTAIVGLENRLEPLVQEATPWDLTPLVHRIEGNAVERFQEAVRTPWMDTPLVLVYTVGAFLLYHVPFLVLVVMGRGRSALRLALTLAGVWGVGLACYLVLPVHEVWMTNGPPYGYGQVENVLLEKDPTFRESAAYNNALDNNFPSLHTGVAMGILFALAFARERWLAWLSAPVALGIVLATVYLGIHWFLDLASGLALALAVAWLVHRRWPQEETGWRGGGPRPSEAPAAAQEPS